MAQDGFKRKLTAVLIADVVGYSRLMEEEDMTTVRNLREYQEVIASYILRYGGRVIDSPGDNLLSEFKSAVDAVQCAVKIQRKLSELNAQITDDRKMEYRIGINLDDVIEEGGKIYGDGVNVAARLESLAEPGGICISGVVYDQVKKKLNIEYQFVGRKSVKNIEEAVPVYRVLAFPSAASKRVTKAKVESMAFPLPEKPSIAVLPFTNMSGDPAQEYIGDGISENIISALSMGSAIFVIARNSTFTYKGRAVKVQHVAEDLGIQYVLEGSVQKSGDRLRITAQLIDALNGHHLWSERYDRKTGDLFDLQDEITKKIVVSLQVELTSGEQARVFAKSTDNLDAWCYGVKGNYLLDKFNKEDNIKARELLEAAIKLDPEHVLAYVWLGATHSVAAAYGWSESPVDSFKRAHELAQKALTLDDKSAAVHILLGTIFLAQRDHDKAITEGNRSISLAPNLSIAHAHFAATMFFSGRFQEAIALTEKAMRLSPYYPAFYLSPLARSYAFLGRYEEAIATSKQLYDRSRRGDYPEEWALIHLAGLYVAFGRQDEARHLIAEALKINPSLSLEFFKQSQPFKNTEHMKREIEALKKAGLK
ncbi:MAG: tetratricopeptide repeat protein [Desulfobacterales bacterium]|nr:MAG: tetratricopeptide repeat protein [Desulfobacterales bacterium]